MNAYEAIFIFNSTLNTDAVQKAIETVKSTLTKEGGSVTHTADWGRRRLAYLIKKAYEGHYVLIRFTSDPDKMDRIRRVFLLNEELLKFLIVRYDEKRQNSYRASKALDKDKKEDDHKVTENQTSEVSQSA